MQRYGETHRLNWQDALADEHLIRIVQEVFSAPLLPAGLNVLQGGWHRDEVIDTADFVSVAGVLLPQAQVVDRPPASSGSADALVSTGRER